MCCLFVFFCCFFIVGMESKCSVVFNTAFLYLFNGFCNLYSNPMPMANNFTNQFPVFSHLQWVINQKSGSMMATVHILFVDNFSVGLSIYELKCIYISVFCIIDSDEFRVSMLILWLERIIINNAIAIL